MEDLCHCGADLNVSDHCPECYCEQYESTCEFIYGQEDE